MAVQDEASFKRYAANGVATVYAIPFLLLAAADLQVTLDGELVTSGFTVIGLGSNTGQIQFAAAPAGDLLLQRVVPFQRLTDYQDNGDLLSGTVNRDLDRLWLAVQELRRDDGRALVVSPLEPEGIPPLPVRALRQLRMLAFDPSGNPIPSNLTLEQLEQQPNLAAAAVAAAQASALESAGYANQSATSASDAEGSADDAANAAAAAATSVTEADAIAQSLTGAAVPMFAVMFWPKRSSIPAGYIAADGQLLSRATYPTAATAILAGTVPTATDAAWLADPMQRGKYTTGDGSTTFRLPDYNGKFAGSLGAVFLRGDGALSAGVAGAIQRDATQLVQGEFGARSDIGSAFDSSGLSGPFKLGSAKSLLFSGTTNPTFGVAFDNSLVARTASENRPLNVTGCWVIKLFGAVTEAGSANAAQLASDYANLAARMNVQEGRQLALGDGQTWQVLTGTRAAGTTYTNSSGRSIEVAVTCSHTATAGGALDVLVGGATIINSLAYATGNRSTVTFVVPAGATYRVNLTNATLHNWSELRA